MYIISGLPRYTLYCLVLRDVFVFVCLCVCVFVHVRVRACARAHYLYVVTSGPLNLTFYCKQSEVALNPSTTIDLITPHPVDFVSI